MKNTTKSNTLKNVLIFILAVVLVTGVTIIQYYSGFELAFSLFYIFPVIIVTWQIGIWTGIIISLMSAITMLVNDAVLSHQFSSNIIPYLNNIFRLIIYFIITLIVTELKNALEKQKELARIDPLTSIANSRAFYETAVMEFLKAKRHDFPISVIYLDLDNFKKVNDTMGHTAGDYLLKLVAMTITKNIRNIDIVARLGGDEFGILLSQTGEESAFVVASKVREMILEIMHNNSWPVSASIGIVTYIKTPGSVDEMIQKADSLMYAAKADGKNTIKRTVIR